MSYGQILCKLPTAKACGLPCDIGVMMMLYTGLNLVAIVADVYSMGRKTKKSKAPNNRRGFERGSNDL